MAGRPRGSTKSNTKKKDPGFHVAKWAMKSTAEPGIGLNIRVGGRIKKTKAIFDPSDNAETAKKRIPVPELKPLRPAKTIVEKKVKEEKEKPIPTKKESSSSDEEEQILSKDRSAEPGPSSVSPASPKKRRPPVVGKKPTFYKTVFRKPRPEMVEFRNRRRRERRRIKSGKTCKYCSKSLPDRMKSCLVCKAKAHEPCARNVDGTRFNKENNFRCPECIKCVICDKSRVLSAANPLVTCNTCCISFHAKCHLPPIVVTSKLWTCRKCSTEKPLETKTEADPMEDFFDKIGMDNFDSKTINNLLEVPNPRSDPKLEDKSPQKMKIQASVIPDASAWTADEVYNYFCTEFPKEAKIFREQEIDGSSLLLMKRGDVINGLNFKLGPALRLYKRIIMLQTRSADPRLTWY